MTEQLTEREKMLTTMLTSVAQALKDSINCPECKGVGFTVTNVSDIYVKDIGNKLVLQLEIDACDCKKQAQSVLNIIRNYEGEETVSETA